MNPRNEIERMRGRVAALEGAVGRVPVRWGTGSGGLTQPSCPSACNLCSDHAPRSYTVSLAAVLKAGCNEFNAGATSLRIDGSLDLTGSYRLTGHRPADWFALPFTCWWWCETGSQAVIRAGLSCSGVVVHSNPVTLVMRKQRLASGLDRLLLALHVIRWTGGLAAYPAGTTIGLSAVETSTCRGGPYAFSGAENAWIGAWSAVSTADAEPTE